MLRIVYLRTTDHILLLLLHSKLNLALLIGFKYAFMIVQKWHTFYWANLYVNNSPYKLSVMAIGSNKIYEYTCDI